VAESVPERLARLTPHPVSVCAGVLILVQLLVRQSFARDSFWWQDDYGHLLFARRSDLDAGFLVRDYNDHLEVLPNLAYWLFAQAAHPPFIWAAVVMVALQAAASILMFLLLQELVGRRPVVLVALTVYLFSPLMLVTGTWFAASVEALPLQVSLLGATWAMVRFGRSGRLAWLIASLGFHVLGLASWEKAALVLPFMLGTHLLLLGVGQPWRERLSVLRQHPVAWAQHGVLLAGFLVVYARVVDGSERTSVVSGDFLEATGRLVGEVFVPGLIGAPWTDRGAQNTIYPEPSTAVQVLSVAVLLAVVAACLVRGGRRAAGPLILGLGYLAVDVVLMLWGRSSFLGLVSGDPRYVTDAVPVVVICLCVAWVSGVRDPEEPGLAVGYQDLAPTAGIAAMIAASCLLTSFRIAPHFSYEYSRNYTEGMVARIAQNPGAGIVDTAAPPIIVGNLSNQGVLLALGHRVAFDQPSTDLRIFDGLSELREIELVDVAYEETGPRRSCGWIVSAPDRVIGEPDLADEEQRVVRLGVVTGVEGILDVTSDGRAQSLAVPSGVSLAYFVFRSVDELAVSFSAEDDRGACITDVTIGRPWPSG
jgi:hypothetical protein